MPEVPVNSYIRNGRTVRAYRRRGRQGRGESVIDKVIDYGLGPADKNKPRPKITIKGKNAAVPDHAVTFGTVNVNGDSPTVRLRLNPITKAVSLEVEGLIGTLGEKPLADLLKRLDARLQKWIGTNPKELQRKISKNSTVLDETMLMNDKVWANIVEPMFAKEVDAWAKANGGDITGRLPPKVIPSKKAK